jgi:hypothetical protein
MPIQVLCAPEGFLPDSKPRPEADFAQAAIFYQAPSKVQSIDYTADLAV